tara:strand:- start:5847 stop:6098 length:252 start_codon:yes stop_codon:yes gene_type:complete
MSEEKEMMIQVSVSIRESKFEFIKSWANQRDDKVANICRGWIYTGLADLQEALGIIRHEPPMEVALPKEESETDENLEQPSVH